MAKAPASKKAKGDKKEYRLIKKKSGKYAVMKKGKLVNGADKVAILEGEGLIKKLKPKAAKAAE
ncbi:MAG: hypothetical protein V4655_10020 [Bdellovibrionota bacterium]